MVAVLEGFSALSFDFLHFIHGLTIGFSEKKNERLITGKKIVNFSCISASLYFLRRGS